MMSLNAASMAAPRVGWKTRPAGPRRHGGEGMLAAQIAAGVIGDGHHQHGVNRGVGQLGGIERGVEILHAGGVPAIGDNHHHLAAVAHFQLPRRQEDGVIQGRAGFALDQRRECSRGAWLWVKKLCSVTW